MKSIRVLVTNGCNASCPNCINKAVRHNSNIMSANVFRELSEYFSNNGVKNIRIMGGEPTIHPHFSQIIEIAQRYFERVTIFTNAINETISNISPRELDSINYNFSFSEFFNEKKLLSDKPGTRIFEVVISRKTNLGVLLDRLNDLHRYRLNQVIISLSLDCTENIFLYRTILVEKFEKAYIACNEYGYEVIFDHSLPICFIYGTQIPIRKEGAMCSGDCAGMIDSDLKIHFCNQVSKDNISIKEKEKFIPFSVLINYLNLIHMKNQVKVLEKICMYCPFYGRFCNGGCFVHSDTISKQDILNNTSLPQ